MATRTTRLFERNRRGAAPSGTGQDRPMIRTVMNRSDWLTLLALAIIWGSAFMFISVAVHEVAPLTYVWLRLTIATAAMWLFLWWRGESAGLPRAVWGSMIVLAL